VIRNVVISRGNLMIRYGDGNYIHETVNEHVVVSVVVKTRGNMMEHHNEGRNICDTGNEHVCDWQHCDKSWQRAGTLW
jgi:hypothetical protein